MGQYFLDTVAYKTCEGKKVFYRNNFKFKIAVDQMPSTDRPILRTIYFKYHALGNYVQILLHESENGYFLQSFVSTIS